MAAHIARAGSPLVAAHLWWWRASYGPGTNFPHQDKSNSAIVRNGAKGGIEMATQDAAWLYQHTSLGDTVLVY